MTLNPKAAAAPNPAPWRLQDPSQSTELTAILDAEGNYVAQWVHKRNQPLFLAAPDLLAAAEEVRAHGFANLVEHEINALHGGEASIEEIIDLVFTLSGMRAAIKKAGG